MLLKTRLAKVFFIVTLFTGIVLVIFLLKNLFNNKIGSVLGAQADPPTSLVQYKSDRSTVINTGGTTDETTVVLKMSMSDPDTHENLQAFVELLPIGTSFTGNSTHQSESMPYTGTPVTATVSVTGLSTGTSYHWQARVCDNDSNCSSWVTYGGNSETDADFVTNGGGGGGGRTKCPKSSFKFRFT